MENKNRLKRIFTFAFFFLVMFLSFYTIFKGQDLEQILSEIKNMSIPNLCISVIMSLSYVCMEGIMIFYLLHSIDKTCEFHDCLKYSFTGFFYSAITPSASGGQPMQLYYMAKDNHQFNKSFVILMIVATLNKIVLVLLGLGLLLFAATPLMNLLNKTGTMMNIKFGSWFYIGLAIDFGWVIILVSLMCFTEQIRKASIWLTSRIFRNHPEKSNKIKFALNDFFRGYRHSVTFVVKNPMKMFVVTILSVFQRICPILITLFVYMGLGIQNIPAMFILMLQAAIYVTVDMIPVPGAQGITEIMYHNVYLSLIGENRIMSSMYITRGVNFYLPLLVGAVVSIFCYFYYLKKRNPNFEKGNI